MSKLTSHGKTRLLGNSASMLLSIMLVLFVFGLLLFIEYHSYLTTHDMKERITFKVDLAPDVSDSAATALQATLAGYDYIKQVDYISAEEAAQLFSDELGDDFVDFLGYNPLYPSLMVNFKSGLLPEREQPLIETFTTTVAQLEGVTGVQYQENVVQELNDLFYRMSWFLILFIALLLFISVILISNTIKLAIYTTQNTIQTMQLVGAKDSFIARPFLRKSVIVGLLAGLLADVAIALAITSFSTQFGLSLMGPDHYLYYGIMAAALPVVGVLIAYFSALFSIKHYLRKKIR